MSLRGLAGEWQRGGWPALRAEVIRCAVRGDRWAAPAAFCLQRLDRARYHWARHAEAWKEGKLRPQPPAAGSASVPFMITQAMRRRLQDEHGLSQSAISALSPAEAHRILGPPPQTAAPAAETGVVLPGARVKRGPGWDWGDQDGGAGNLGTVTAARALSVDVDWDRGGAGVYRWGIGGVYDLEVVTQGRAQPQQASVGTSSPTAAPAQPAAPTEPPAQLRERLDAMAQARASQQPAAPGAAASAAAAAAVRRRQAASRRAALTGAPPPPPSPPPRAAPAEALQ
eukprot:TRINITY_DN28647_c0_g1_i2.p1 TRINITY_DN28647_c0_g1~~TRINITY_DN28647_c0_g1_i2.p1  ORF type:complete len:311 (+),score=81.13 TRINITY_DN28647_c0_g1_i2:82-933(+)